MGGFFGGGGNNISTSETPAAGVKFQSSSYGAMIPIVYGKTRIAPNIVWYGDFVAVPHTSTQSGGGKGGGQSYSNTTYTYTASFMLGLCEGPIQSVGKAWIGTSSQDATNKFAQLHGGYDQMPWSYLQGAHPDQAVAYRGLALVAANGYDLGTSPNLPNHNFEVTGALTFDAETGTYGANPKDIIWDLLQNQHYGVPGIDAGWLGDWQAYSNYCIATGLLLSPAYTSQTAANQMIEDLVNATNSGIYFSEAKIKIVPYGDASAYGNGVTYTPDFGEMPSIGDDDFQPSDSEDPVIVVRNGIGQTRNASSSAVAYNQFTIEYLDRENDYNVATITVQDQAHIDTYGLRPASVMQYHQIVDGSVAATVVQIALQRSISIRNQYKFKLGWQWCGLEPTDIVCLNDSVLGLVDYPVRLLSAEEDDAGVISFVAEDAPLGAFSHVKHTPPSGQGYSANTIIAPGSTHEPVIFQPTNAMTAPNAELWIAASGGEFWGGCEVWASDSNYAYKRIGVIYNPARHGVLTQSLPDGTDPDTTHTLYADLTASRGQLLSGSQADADNLVTLLWVDGEIMSYETANLSGQYQYGLTYLRRGQLGSESTSHPQGAKLARLDDAIFKYVLPQNRIGSTLWIKLPAFNIYGQGLQSLDQATAYSFTPEGAKPNPLTSLATTSGTFEVTINWAFSQGQLDRDYTEIWASTTQNFADAKILTSAKSPSSQFAHVGLYPGTKWYYWGRVVDTSGNYSDFLPSTTQSGIEGAASTNADDILAALEKAIGLQQLADEIAQPIGKIDALDFASTWEQSNNQVLKDGLTALKSQASLQASAQVTTEKTERTQDNAALAQQITTVAATAGQALAAVQTEQTARASGDNALAQSVVAVQARLNTGDYAAVKETVTATASALDGVKAKYLLQVDANGHVSAINLQSGDDGGSMVFLADKFMMAKPDGTGASPLLEIGTVNGVNVLGFKGALIGASGTFSGALQAASGTFLGELQAATGSFAGSLMAGVLDFSALAGHTENRSSPGVYYFTLAADESRIRYQIMAGGGGGAMGHGGEWNEAAGGGGGGGAGEYRTGTIELSPGTQIRVIVGSGGAGGTTPYNVGYYDNWPANGSAGTYSSVDYWNGSSWVTLVSANPGQGGSAAPFNHWGGGGQNGWFTAGSGGSGYPSGASAVGGNAENGASAAGGAGASTVWGRGGSPGYPNAGWGGAGTGYGAGGGGAAGTHEWSGDSAWNRGSSGGGGSGTGGKAIIEFFNPNTVVLRSEFITLSQRVTAIENRLVTAGIS